VLAGILFYYPGVLYSHSKPIKKILFLNSYHPGKAFSDNIFDEVKKILAASDIKHELFVEYMDTKRYHSAYLFPILKETYILKYKDYRFDLILASDNNALDFIVKNRNELFPGVPVVFSGINNFKKSMIDRQKNITGVIEAVDMKGTLDLILHLQPMVKDVYVVADVTETGQLLLDELRQFYPHYANAFNFIELNSLPLNELMTKLKEIPKHAALFYLPYFRDPSGIALSMEDGLRMITTNCACPIYTCWEEEVQYGVLGGVVTSGKGQGEAMAEMALKILNRTPADNIPIRLESPNLTIVDYGALVKFAIPFMLLPKGSVILNEPESFFYENRNILIVAGVFFILQLVIIILLIINVFRRRIAEGIAHENEEKYRFLIENSSDLIVRFHPDGYFQFVSPSFSELVGYSEEELLHTQYMPFVHPDDRAITRKMLDSLNRSPFSSYIEHRILTPQGWKWIAWSNKAARGAKDEIIAVVSAGHDITDRMDAERKIRENEERFRLMIEESPIPIVVTNTQNTILILNNCFIETFGYSREEMKTLDNWWMSAYPDENYRKDIIEMWNSQRGEGEVRLHESRAMCKDGSQREVEYLITSVGLWYLIYLYDVTEKKKMEMEINKIQRIESIGILAGGIAHDFNNLLTAILGNVSICRSTVQGDDEIYEYLGEAETACLKARELTRQLLTFSKGGDPVKKTGSVAELIKESVTFLLRGSKVRYSFDFPESPWLANFDEGQMSQVFSNLIINAREAMPEGGKLSVIMENFHFNGVPPIPIKPGTYIKIMFQDNGKGIPKSDLKRIFDPYYTTKPMGHGLGLASVFSILSKHEGYIYAESELGQGTVFSILLPALEDNGMVDIIKKTGLILGKGKILLLDDDEQVQKTVDSMLKILGYDVQCAGDGDQAIEMYKNAAETGNPFIAVLLDLTIPGGKGGLDTLKILKEIDPKVKAIVVSGYSNDPVMANYKKHGFCGVLEKPYKIEAISEMLYEVINS
jgi:PAS domain S-box-containing protein